MALKRLLQWLVIGVIPEPRAVGALGPGEPQLQRGLGVEHALHVGRLIGPAGCAMQVEEPLCERRARVSVGPHATARWPGAPTWSCERRLARMLAPAGMISR